MSSAITTVHKYTNLCHAVPMETTTSTQPTNQLAGARTIIELLLDPATRDNPGVVRTAQDWIRNHGGEQ